MRWVAWNSFLAFVPVAAAYGLAWVAATREGRSRGLTRFLAAGLGLVWLTYLPNTCYLLTEWRHFLEVLSGTDLYTRWHLERQNGAMVRLVVYTCFYGCYSALGMLSFALAIRPVDRLSRRWCRRPWLWQAPFFALMALGVYLGLVLRFNSWDLISRPLDVLAAAAEVPFRPLLAALVAAFAVFLWLAYLTVDIWVDGLLLRLSWKPPAQEE